MTDTIENRSTDTDQDDKSASLHAIHEAIEAGITPRWWSYAVRPDGGIDTADALVTFAERVRAFGDIVSESDDEAHVGIGHSLEELGNEALALIGFVRESEMQQAETPRTEALPRDDAGAKALLDRYLRRLTDVYPFRLATSLYGVALYARSDKLAELERCVTEIEGATFPGWASDDVGASPRAGQDNDRKFEGATHVHGEDYLPIRGRPDDLIRDLLALLESMFPEDLAEHFESLLTEAMYRDWPAMEASMKAIQRHRLGGRIND